MKSVSPAIKLTLRDFMRRLTDDSRHVKPQFKNAALLHGFLLSEGFMLVWVEHYGPEGGVMLQYWSRVFIATGKGLIVRVKTKGEKLGRHRANQAHLSVCFQDGVSVESLDSDEASVNTGKEDYRNHEKHKLDRNGGLVDKGATCSEFTHFDFYPSELIGAMELRLTGSLITVGSELAPGTQQT